MPDDFERLIDLIQWRYWMLAWEQSLYGIRPRISHSFPISWRPQVKINA